MVYDENSVFVSYFNPEVIYLTFFNLISNLTLINFIEILIRIVGC